MENNINKIDIEEIRNKVGDILVEHNRRKIALDLADWQGVLHHEDFTAINVSTIKSLIDYIVKNYTPNDQLQKKKEKYLQDFKDYCFKKHKVYSDIFLLQLEDYLGNFKEGK